MTPSPSCVRLQFDYFISSHHKSTLPNIGPIIPSIASYVAGLLFYATRFPECALPVDSPRLAWLGGGSHALWHIFIVRAISLHRDALPLLRNGVVSGATSVCSVLAK
jgi:predicted membrane channel-forming protein YqfA (hemolysin III family)